MPAEWYYKSLADGERGPFTSADLKRLAEARTITADSLVRKGPQGQWVPATKVKGLPIGLLTPSTSNESNNSTLSPPWMVSRSVGVVAVVCLIGCLGIVAAIVFQKSPTTNQTHTHKPYIPVSTQSDTARQLRDITEKRKQAYPEAKRILLDRLDFVGGRPEENVKKGIALLQDYLMLPEVPNRTEATLLLEHAQTAISTDKAIEFLELIDDIQRRQFASDPRLIAMDSDMVIVSQVHVDTISPDFSDRFRSKIVSRDSSGPKVFVCSEFYRGGGQGCNSLETAFHATVLKNAKAVVVKVETRKQKQREAKEAKAVLRNGTDEFKRVVEYPEKYEFGHFYFNGSFGSRFGNMKRDKQANCYTVAFRCDGKQILANGFGLSKDNLNFVVSDELGNKLLDLRDGEFFARIYCRIRYANPDYRTFPVASIYKVELHTDASCSGRPEITVE